MRKSNHPTPPNHPPSLSAHASSICPHVPRSHRPVGGGTRFVSLTHPIPSPVLQSRTFSESHARATPTSLPLPPASRFRSRQVFRRLSLARPPHPRASRHGSLHGRRSAFVRARVRVVRSSGLVCSTLANVGLESASARAQGPGCALNSIVNGRTYTRYALGLCTGLSRKASSQ